MIIYDKLKNYGVNVLMYSFTLSLCMNPDHLSIEGTMCCCLAERESSPFLFFLLCWNVGVLSCFYWWFYKFLIRRIDNHTPFFSLDAHVWFCFLFLLDLFNPMSPYNLLFNFFDFFGFFGFLFCFAEVGLCCLDYVLLKASPRVAHLYELWFFSNTFPEPCFCNFCSVSA